MLSWVLDRLGRADGVEKVVVATSNLPDDDRVAKLCIEEGVPCHRGSLDDVAGRCLDAAGAHGIDAFARISGDSPLIDHRVVAAGVARFRDSEPDVTTNVFPRRTCPNGQSVEVISCEALRRARVLMVEPGDCVDVTPALYRHPDRFAIQSFDMGEDLSGTKMTVDTEEDAQVVEAMLREMDRPHWEYSVRDLIELRRAVDPGHAVS